MRRLLHAVLTALVLLPSAALAQSALLMGGPWVPGHAPIFVGSGFGQPIVQDGGAASGGGPGVGLSELNITSRAGNSSTTPPYANSGSGPLASHGCMYDAPTTNSTGYHYLCFDPNAQGGGLIDYGAGGGASNLPLTFVYNGVSYAFPFSVGGIAGPGTTVVGDMACWNNTVGTLLKDCTLGAGVGVALANPVGASGSVVVNGGALGTPSSANLSNATGLPISTGVTGVDTTVKTALANPVNGAGGFVTSPVPVLNGGFGTPAVINGVIGLELYTLNSGSSTNQQQFQLNGAAGTFGGYFSFGAVNVKGYQSFIGYTKASDLTGLSPGQYVGATAAGYFVGDNDYTGSANPAAWGVYGEGRSKYGKFAAGVEADCENTSGGALDSNTPTPYNIFGSGGGSVCFGDWISPGGTLAPYGAYDVTAAIGIAPSGSTQSVTVTSANPAVVTLAAHGLTAGAPVSFGGGSTPSGITTGKLYYVLAAGLTANTFEFSTTIGGSPVATSSTGSSVTVTTGGRWKSGIVFGENSIRNDTGIAEFLAVPPSYEAHWYNAGSTTIAWRMYSDQTSGATNIFEMNGSGIGINAVGSIGFAGVNKALVIGDSTSASLGVAIAGAGALQLTSGAGYSVISDGRAGSELIIAGQPGGAQVTLAAGMNVTGLPTTGTAAASLCIDSSGNIFKKTTAGACL